MSNALQEKRVLVTRAKGQNTKLSRQLASVGAVPVEFPTIEVTPPDDTGPLDTAIANLTTYQWLIFTSVNGVKYFWQRFLAAGREPAELADMQVAAVGPATAAELKALGLTIDVIPSEHVAEALVEAMNHVADQCILLPTADIARDTLLTGLQAKGASVDRVTAYQTRPVENPGNLRELLPTLDVLTFTSGSTVRSFVNLLRAAGTIPAIGTAIVACIGPITAQAAEELMLPVDVVADTYTIPGLVAALVKYFEHERSPV